jgi:Zn finger protein HypA/HybF (possibly regulating hydrogenase expression)
VSPLHEIGVMIEVVKTVENFAKKNSITKIETLVLQIGELSSMIPRYIEACYPAAVDGTLLQDTQLKIEILPGNAMCKKCNKVFNLIENNNKCPHCEGREWEILSGREFMIKEIVAC